MTHKQIWTEIAEAYLTPESEGTKRQLNLARGGLCWAADERLGFQGKIYKLLRELHSYESWLFWFPARRLPLSDGTKDPNHRRDYDLIRGDMATLFSCMTKREFNLLLAGTPAQLKTTNVR